MDKLKQKISKIIKPIKKFIYDNDVEIPLFLGIFFILHATFLVNYIVFLYILGLILIAFSIFLLKYPKK